MGYLSQWALSAADFSDGAVPHPLDGGESYLHPEYARDGFPFAAGLIAGSSLGEYPLEAMLGPMDLRSNAAVAAAIQRARVDESSYGSFYLPHPSSETPLVHVDENVAAAQREAELRALAKLCGPPPGIGPSGSGDDMQDVQGLHASLGSAQENSTDVSADGEPSVKEQLKGASPKIDNAELATGSRRPNGDRFSSAVAAYLQGGEEVGGSLLIDGDSDSD